MRKLLVNTSGRCGRMRASAWQCAQCHDCHELPRIVHEQLTSSSRVVHDMFTSSSRHVHEQFTTNARQSVRGYIQGFLDTARYSRDRQRGDNLYHRDNMPLQESRRNGRTCHDKIVAKSRASVSLALVFISKVIRIEKQHDFSLEIPALVAQWWAYRTHDLVVISSKPGWGEFFSGVF